MRDDWTETTLGEVGEAGLFTDGDWVESKDQDPAGDYRLLQLADIGDGVFLNKSSRYMNDAQFKRLRCTPLRHRDILIARMPDPIARACLFPPDMPVSATVVDVAILRCEDPYSPEFLVLAINDVRFREAAYALLTGTTRQRISRSNLSKIIVNLPPIAEQRRVVDVVSSVDAYIDALQQHVDAARVARNAVLHELLTAGGDDWTETTLGDIASFEYGKPLKAENRDGVGFPVFGSAGEVGRHSEPLIRDAPVIVVGRKGTAGAVWWSHLPCSVIDTAYFVVPRISLNFNFLFLLLGFLDLPSLTAQTGVPGLNRDRAYSSEVNLPPVAEQGRIVEIVSSMDDVIRAAERAVVEAKNLRSGLLSDLLSGEHEIPVSYDELLGAA